MTKLKQLKQGLSDKVSGTKQRLNTNKIPGKERKDLSLKDVITNQNTRRKLLITLGLIVVYRVLAAIPLPGINVELFAEVFGNNPLTNFFSIVTGGRLDNPSVVALGLGAYINASIIIQLLATAIPKLEELRKEGDRGRRILNQYTRLLTVPLTVVQAIVIYTILRSVAQSVPQLAGLLDGVTTFDIISMVAALTAGSMVLMWLGELISEYGIGNGISILITVGILAVMPSLFARDFVGLSRDFDLLMQGNLNVLLNDSFILLALIVAGFYLLVLFIVYVNEATRKITIQYARRVRNAPGALTNFLPLKLNQAGVMPVIFASALLSFPQIIAQLLLGVGEPGTFLFNLGNTLNNSFLGSSGISQSGFNTDTIYYILTYFLLIIAFSFFYTFVNFKPKDTAENLQKSGGFIPGLRPGKTTESYLTKVMLRLTSVGSVFLAGIAILPILLRLFPTAANLSILSGIGGTSILIIVGVVLDTIRQLKAAVVTRSYEQYR